MSRRSLLTRQLGTFQRTGEAAFTSSRQFGPVQLAAAEAPVGVEGLAMGKSMCDGQGFLHDPFLLYPKHLADPNVLLFGGQGTGKSTTGKGPFCLRQRVLGRRVAVLDNRPYPWPDGVLAGEYRTVCEALGIPAIRLGRGSGVRFNLFDPRIVEGIVEGPAAGDGGPQRREPAVEDLPTDAADAPPGAGRAAADDGLRGDGSPAGRVRGVRAAAGARHRAAVGRRPA